MRRQAQEEVAEAARRRLELLRWELDQAGLTPTERPSGTTADPPPVAPGRSAAPAPVAEPGRHVRRARSPAALVGGWFTDRIPMTLRGRVALGAREAALVAVLLAIGVAMAAIVVLRSGSGGTAVPVAHRLAPPTSTSPSAVDQTGGPSPPSGGDVVVDVAGKVRRPGVVTLVGGARVIDAIRKAGGALPRVSLASLNLARVLTDGEQVLVGVAPAPGVAASAASSPGAAPGGPMVSINTATAEQLDTLPGVGPVTAQKILSWRSAHGSFSSVDELLEVDGIGEKTLADLAPYVTL